MRLNKYLSDVGVCSRREADRLIEEKRVLVDGKPAVQGMQVEDFQEIKVDGKAIKREEKKVLLVFHKPKGIECTANPNVKKNVISYINYPIGEYYAGRLDKDSEGLLLLTNQGELVNQIMKAGSYHEKEYLVTVDKPVTEEFLQSMREGVPVLGTITRKCKAEKESEKVFRTEEGRQAQPPRQKQKGEQQRPPRPEKQPKAPAAPSPASDGTAALPTGEKKRPHRRRYRGKPKGDRPQGPKPES